MAIARASVIHKRVLRADECQMIGSWVSLATTFCSTKANDVRIHQVSISRILAGRCNAVLQESSNDGRKPLLQGGEQSATCGRCSCPAGRADQIIFLVPTSNDGTTGRPCGPFFGCCPGYWQGCYVATYLAWTVTSLPTSIRLVSRHRYDDLPSDKTTSREPAASLPALTVDTFLPAQDEHLHWTCNTYSPSILTCVRPL